MTSTDPRPLHLHLLRGLELSSLLVLLLAGCVRTESPRETWQRTPLVVTRDQQGVRLHLRTEKGQRYNILFLERGEDRSQWRPLPQATQIQGTGGIIEIVDNHPNSRNRNYRPQALLEIPADNARRQLQ